MERYYQPEIECASREQIKAWQDERLVKQVRNVWDNVPYYRKKMEEKGLTPDDIKGVADLHKLPFVTKADLREAYPYGLVARPLKDCVRIQSTSGTTGKRVVAFYTQHDIDLWEDCCARAIVAAGGTNEDVCQVSYGYGLFTGGPGLNGGSHKVGCLTIPTSSGNTERQIMFIRDLSATILCCTPSYAAYIGETMKEMGPVSYTHLDVYKRQGLTHEIIKEALEITRDARYAILDEIMLPCIAAPRAEVSKYAPKMITMKIDPDKIREVIGKGGSVIQKITAESGATVDIEDDGTIHIASPNAEACDAAKKMIETIVFVPQVGELYYGKVVRILQFGAFVELAPGKDGMVHILSLIHILMCRLTWKSSDDRPVPRNVAP